MFFTQPSSFGLRPYSKLFGLRPELIGTFKAFSDVVSLLLLSDVNPSLSFGLRPSAFSFTFLKKTILKKRYTP